MSSGSMAISLRAPVHSTRRLGLSYQEKRSTVLLRTELQAPWDEFYQRKIRGGPKFRMAFRIRSQHQLPSLGR